MKATTKPAQFTPGTCQCRWSGAVNFVMCPLHTAAPAMYAIIKDMREAFYVKGTRKALLAVMERSRDVIAQAEGRQA